LTPATILVVEDEEIIARALLRMLKNMDYYPCCATGTGDEAVMKAREYVPDLVLMDIGIPGTINGIEAARIIRQELQIPVIFVTAFTDDATLDKVKCVGPYGYVRKPFTDRDLKIAIELALYRKSAEIPDKQKAISEDRQVIPAEMPGNPDEDYEEYTILPDIRTLFLQDFFNDLVLLVYTSAEVKEPVFSTFIERGLKLRGNLLFAYSLSRAHWRFQDEIHQGKIRVCRMKNGDLSLLTEALSDHGDLSPGVDPAPLRFIIDFSDRFDPGDILAAVDLILAIRKKGVPIVGVIALDAGTYDADMIKSISQRIPKVIVTTSRGMAISCADHSFPLETLSFLPQPAVNETVKKILEPVILSLLEKPKSGYDILHEIQDRYNVIIPQVRVYTQLYALQKQGYLSVNAVGKSKLYSPTETGKTYIHQKLQEFRAVFPHILAGMSDRTPETGTQTEKE